MIKNKRTIPELRERLRELAHETGIEELKTIADEMTRNPPARRARVKHRKLTPKLAEKIRNFAHSHPELHQQEIAIRFRVNHGRVSEALNNQL